MILKYEKKIVAVFFVVHFQTIFFDISGGKMILKELV